MKKKNGTNLQRKRGINATLRLPKNDFFVEDDGLSSIEIYISATPDNWRKLYSLGTDRESMEYLGQLIFLNAVSPGYKTYAASLDNPPSRGIHAHDMGGPKDATEAEFMADSRNYIAAAMAVISYWINKPEHDWPESFAKIIEDLISSKSDIYHKIRKKQLVATKITFAIWKHKFRNRMLKQGLTGPKDLKSFRRVYINNNPRIKAAQAQFKKYGPHATIEDIYASFPENFASFTIAPPAINFVKAKYPTRTPKKHSKNT
jgi:hypothetical protein